MILDSNVLFGFDRLNKQDMSTDGILSLMDEHNIEKAVITCNECMYYNFVEGNDKTAKLVKEYPDRFVGFFSFHPARYINVEQEITRATEELGLKGLRIFFTEVTFGRGWSSGLQSLMLQKILKKANQFKLPVFIEPGFAFAAIKNIADRYPDITFIASGIGYANMADAMIAVQETDNLYLELSTLDAGDGIRFLVKELTAKRLIFGTGMPFITPSVATNYVKFADITDSDRTDIFYQNLTGILERQRGKVL